MFLIKRCECCDLRAFSLAGVDPEEQRLDCGEEVDMEDSQTLHSYVGGSLRMSDVTIWLMISMTVYVQEVTGERHALLVRRWFNLTMLRALIWNIVGVHPGDQRLIQFRGRKLVDGPTLGQFGIGHQNVLHLLQCIRE